jgi:hypothetical protein
MNDEIRREIRRLKTYALVMTALFATMTLAAFKQGAQKQRFTEIDVERINVVEPDGSYRMVISNRPRSIGPIYKGKPFGYPGGSRPGIIFFNDEGTENGGLTFTGKKNPDGTYSARAGFPSTSSIRTRSSTSSTPRKTASGAPASPSRTAPTSTSTTWCRRATRS